MSEEELPDGEAQEVETVEQNEAKPSAELETDQGAELAPAGPEEAEEITEPSETPEDKAQKAINAKHRQYKQEERRRLKLEAELEELRKAQNQVQSDVVEEVPIPELPDSWDENYDKKIVEREEAIRRNAEVRFRKQADEDRRVALETEQKAKAERQRQEKLINYANRAKNFGIEEADLVEAANTVADAQVPQELADFLINAEDGPLLTAYLADVNSDVDLYELRGMNSVELGVKISEIRAKAANLKPRASSAPSPASAIRGKGAPAVSHPALEGATFT
jgi:hypothetical protein